jgi:hypothetical protein
MPLKQTDSTTGGKTGNGLKPSSRPSLVPYLPGFLFLATPAHGPLSIPSPTTLRFETESDWRAKSITLVEEFIRQGKSTPRTIQKSVWAFLHAPYPERHRFTQQLIFLASQTQDDRLIGKARLLPKHPVRVTRGSLQGLKGVVSSPESGPPAKSKVQNRKVRVFVELELLGRWVSAEVPEEDLEPI